MVEGQDSLVALWRSVRISNSVRDTRKGKNTYSPTRFNNLQLLQSLWLC